MFRIARLYRASSSLCYRPFRTSHSLLFFLPYNKVKEDCIRIAQNENSKQIIARTALFCSTRQNMFIQYKQNKKFNDDVSLIEDIATGFCVGGTILFASSVLLFVGGVVSSIYFDQPCGETLTEWALVCLCAAGVSYMLCALFALFL